ncbi:nucleotidyltransferase domain-containing protein [Sulfurimonas sp.]|uniref:nucleotidyltransferase domain-containing protein n=1 Tax=Sulfurimonas sp. TaxID=2022749 RepID=UPI0026078F0C|nr:nucleotidyltransferase domain-containing protein [Sulfurimonas sp.]
MRLSTYEVDAIKDTFKDIFQNGDIYLFGSRIDDDKKGGDIDLYIKLSSPLQIKDMMVKKSKFRLKLEDKIGEQKIDIIISRDTSRPIEKEALQKGIKL